MCRERPRVAATLTYAWVKITMMYLRTQVAAIEILSPHAGTPCMESCRKLVNPAKHKSLIQIETIRKELHVIGNWFQLKTGEHHGG